jgi:PPR repeat
MLHPTVKLGTVSVRVRAQPHDSEISLKQVPFFVPSLGVINAWVRCGNMKNAEEILKRMESFEATYGPTTMSPNVISYTTIMDGWAKSLENENESITKMEHVFHRLLCTTMKPNLVTYVTLVDAYTRPKTPNVQHIQKADDMVRQMYSNYVQDRNNNVKPNKQLITMVIDAWKRSKCFNSAENAENLLDWLISIHRDENDVELAPNEYTFSCKLFVCCQYFF